MKVLLDSLRKLGANQVLTLKRSFLFGTAHFLTRAQKWLDWLSKILRLHFRLRNNTKFLSLHLKCSSILLMSNYSKVRRQEKTKSSQRRISTVLHHPFFRLWPTVFSSSKTGAMKISKCTKEKCFKFCSSINQKLNNKKVKKAKKVSGTFFLQVIGAVFGQPVSNLLPLS